MKYIIRTGQAVMLIISLSFGILLLLFMWYTPTEYKDDVIINTSPQMDTVEVITEDGIRWYTLDTIVYEK